MTKADYENILDDLGEEFLDFGLSNCRPEHTAEELKKEIIAEIENSVLLINEEHFEYVSHKNLSEIMGLKFNPDKYEFAETFYTRLKSDVLQAALTLSPSYQREMQDVK